MSFETIRINENYDGQVIELALNMPPANILSARMMGEISRFMRQQRHNDKLKLIVFKGDGKDFCFGASVEEHTADQVTAMLPKFHNTIGEILGYPVPTLAQVTGYCLGGGFELALACSFIVADETAKFSVPEIRLGVFPPVAAVLLPYLAKSAVTVRMIITGTMLDAVGLREAGLAALVADKGDIQAAVDAFIKEEIVPKSSSSLRFAHQAARLSLVRHYRGLIKDMEKLYLNELMKTHDANEGIHSFLEKRSPVWTGN
ncbi:MAG: enoyl-CoA hydratase/isomerase family protein [Chloracidobacterium sp.]|nr:enoyl-CoA hydratase/isomerase family protein [Chloracidobacterium sp.]